MRLSYPKQNSMSVPVVLCDFVVRQLLLPDYKRSVSGWLLGRLLLLAACFRRSLSQVSQWCRQAPGRETVRKALLAYLPGRELLLARLIQSLHALLPQQLKRRPQPAAIDLHLRPYYGDIDTPGVRGGQRHAGTRYFWSFATLVLLRRGQRFTVGLATLQPHEPLEAVVHRLLQQAREAGVQLRYVLLDRGFYDACVVDLLQQHRIPFVMPMIRRGNAEKGTGTTDFFRVGRFSEWTNYTWTTQPRRWDPETEKKKKTSKLTVQVKVCLFGGGEEEKAWVLIASGIHWCPSLVAKRYRSRFGIESSYRQLGEVLAATCSKDECVRLLLVGMALILRQFWCVLQEGSGAHRALAEMKMALLLELMEKLEVVVDLGSWNEVQEPEPLTAA